MAVDITYFVHGTTTDNEKDISSGWYDVELSKLGIKQSIDLKNLIRKLVTVAYLTLSSNFSTYSF